MYELISRESLESVIGGAACSCAQQPDPAAAGQPDPSKGKQPGGEGGPGGEQAPAAGAPTGSGCDQLLQAINALINIFSGLARSGAGPSQPKKPTGAQA